jgi:cytochrome c553
LVAGLALAVAALAPAAGQTAAGVAQASSAGAAAAPKGDRELGEYLSNQCTTCHQISGMSVGAIPPIVGWPDEQFIAVIQSYKEGVRDNETMRTISHRFSNEEIEALAAYFGSLKPAQ